MERLPVQINPYSEYYVLLCANIALVISTKHNWGMMVEVYHSIT